MEAKGSQVLEDYLRNLHTEMQDSESIYSRVNILALSEEQKERAYESWGKDTVATFGAGSADDMFLEGEQKENKLWSGYEGFLKGGEKYSQLYAKGENQPKKLWSEARLAINLDNTDYYVFASKSYPSLQTYYDMFLDNIRIVLDEDLSFPLPLPLTEIL